MNRFFLEALLFCFAALVIVSMNCAIAVFIINHMPNEMWDAIMRELCGPFRIHPVALFYSPSVFVLGRLAWERLK